jgi:hypothetical protein
MIADVVEFLATVVRHYHGLLTGGLIAALVVVYVGLSGHELAREIYLVLFLVYFVISCFLTWRDEHRRARLFDDRQRQQEIADEYAPLVQQGRKIMVKWVDAARPASKESNAEQRAAAFAWLDVVRIKLADDFGAAVATHFNLGKPLTTDLGVSEPLEHQARVLALDDLIAQMRDGRLPLRVRRPQ